MLLFKWLNMLVASILLLNAIIPFNGWKFNRNVGLHGE